MAEDSHELILEEHAVWTLDLSEQSITESSQKRILILKTPPVV